MRRGDLGFSNLCRVASVGRLEPARVRGGRVQSVQHQPPLGAGHLLRTVQRGSAGVPEASARSTVPLVTVSREA
jgi:hypothetical protein